MQPSEYQYDFKRLNYFKMARKKQDIILENVVIEAVAAEGKALAKIGCAVRTVRRSW